MFHVVESNVVEFFLWKLAVDELDEPEGFRVLVDQAEGVWNWRSRQELLVFVLGLIGRKPAPLQVPVIRTVKKESEIKRTKCSNFTIEFLNDKTNF